MMTAHYDKQSNLPPMSPLDRQIMDVIQARFPVTSQPYDEVGKQLGVTEGQVMERVHVMYEQDRIRRIGPIFDTYKLGYVSTLVGCKIPPERLDEVAQIVNSYIEVTHNYMRDHEFNMWFTLIAPGDEHVERILSEMRKSTGIEHFYSMPFTTRYKVWVEFSTTGKCQHEKPGPQLFRRDFQNTQSEIEDADIPFVRAIQIDIPFTARPYAAIGEKVGLDEEQVIKKIKDWKRRRIIRRWGAVVRHQKIGYDHNAMGVWSVPDGQVDDYGMKIAAFDAVSHCYTRRSAPGWPYNLYSMVHGLSDDECINAIKEVAAEVELDEYDILFSVKEFKRSDMEYFPLED